MALEREARKRPVEEQHDLIRLVGAATWTKLLLASALLFALGIFIGARAGTYRQGKPINPAPVPQPIDEKSIAFQSAIRAANEAIEKNDFQTAYDLILAASLLRPTSGDLFDAVLRFIDTAAAGDNEEANFLAEDLLSRGEALVAYQSVSSIPAARKRFEETARRMAAKDAPPPEVVVDPVEPIAELVRHAGNKKWPVDIRTRACAAARHAIAELRFSLVTNPSSDAKPGTLPRLAECETQIDQSEQACIALAFQPLGKRAERWISDTNTLMSDIKAWTDGKRDLAKVEQLKQQIHRGTDLLTELTPYSQSGVAAADQILAEIDASLEAAQRGINWAYNIEILTRVRNLEGDKKMAAVEKIKLLAAVREEELAPEILRRHNDLWDKVYGELQGEDQQVLAIRMRILRSEK